MVDECVCCVAAQFLPLPLPATHRLVGDLLRAEALLMSALTVNGLVCSETDERHIRDAIKVIRQQAQAQQQR
jgi:hypothetical protein